MTRGSKTHAEVLAEALVAAGLRAPNKRQFRLNDAYAWDLFRPAPSMLPHFPRCWPPKVERDEV